MTSFLVACGWIIAANAIAFFPSRDRHWRAAYLLIALGVPVLIYLYLENGIWFTLIALLAGMSILRWPVYYAWLRVRRLFGSGSDG